MDPGSEPEGPEEPVPPDERSPDREDPPARQPSVSAAYGDGWEGFKRHFGVLLGAVLVTAILQIPGYVDQIAQVLAPFFGWSQGTLVALVVFSFLYSVLVGIPLGYGFSYVNLKAVRDAGPGIGDLFEGFRRFGTALGAAVLSALAVLVGLIFLILPGIWVALRLSFVHFVVVDREVSATEALSESWSMTEGHALQILGFVLLGIPVILLGLLLLLVGVIPAGLWLGVSFAGLYDRIAGQATGASRSVASASDPAGI